MRRTVLHRRRGVSGSTTLQCLCPECAERGRELAGKGPDSGTGEIDGHVSSEIRGLHGGGAPLPGSSRAFFEPKFGCDFAAVRIHADSRAAGLARSINARAFTHGQDIVFGAAEYSPVTWEGRRVLAHELAHVVQQKGTQPPTRRFGAWGPGMVPTSGPLPSTASRPSWWSKPPIEGPAVRSVLASWNCCDADQAKHTFDLEAKP